LLRDDAFIIGSYNEDPRDHALHASITASSQQQNGSAVNVISGQSRAVVTSDQGKSMGSGGGIPASQGKNGTNRLISNGLPASISLSLPTPIPIKQVQLIFDTGMHRKLAYNVVYKTNNPASSWGPQPETVRDYVIEGNINGEWKVLCNVTDNYQRRRVHTLPCVDPTPRPTPPSPPNPVVAAGSVAATMCNVSDLKQRWLISPVTEGYKIYQNAGRKVPVCLGYDVNISAYGGHGNSIVARPCAAGTTATTDNNCNNNAESLSVWHFNESVSGSLIKISVPHNSCSGYAPNLNKSCECVHPVACTACHGADTYAPPTSVE
jgi:hypothetical protein